MINVPELNTGGEMIGSRRLLQLHDLLVFDGERLKEMAEAAGVIQGVAQPLSDVVHSMNLDMAETAMLEIEQTYAALFMKNPHFLEMDKQSKKDLLERLCVTLSSGTMAIATFTLADGPSGKALCLPVAMAMELLGTTWMKLPPPILDDLDYFEVGLDIDSIGSSAKATVEAIQSASTSAKGTFFDEIETRYREAL